MRLDSQNVQLIVCICLRACVCVCVCLCIVKNALVRLKEHVFRSVLRKRVLHCACDWVHLCVIRFPLLTVSAGLSGHESCAEAGVHRRESISDN